MEKGLLFFTLALTAIWIILDDFYGGRHLTKMAQKMTPDIGSPLDVVTDGVESAKEAVQDAGKKTVKKGKKVIEKATGYDKYKDVQDAIKKKPELKDQIQKDIKDSFWGGAWKGFKDMIGIG
ncbi:hypothetical protein P9E05_14145 [Bacillus mojavensis]|uniref:hypothetical protein n=1 Tax=Bacillus mojavensis TaxID=72360 RepID=UPI002DBDB6C3|nr:hypothetical protein [Bacillus mojavensis]MEC1692620.1 hypothetical protein [Bacillus mojavensis]